MLKIRRVELPYYLRLLLTYLFVVIVAQTVPVGIFYEWGWHEPFAGAVTVNHILRVVLFLPWMIIAWLVIYDGYENGMKNSRFLIHSIGWLCMGLFFALLAEISQLYIPYRVYSRIDAILSCAGVVSGSVILFFKPGYVWKKITAKL